MGVPTDPAAIAATILAQCVVLRNEAAASAAAAQAVVDALNAELPTLMRAPTSSVLPVNAVVFAIYTNGGTAPDLADGATTDGVFVFPAYISGSTWTPSAVTQLGSWKNISGDQLVDGDKGWFTRVS